MGVDVEVADIAILSLADQIGQFANSLHRDIGIVKENPVLQRQTLVGFDLIANLSKSGGSLRSVHLH